MTAFVWQSLLLLGLAYVLGCWIACLLRRMLGVSARSALPSDAVPAGAIASAAAAGAAIRPAPLVPSPQIVRQPAATPAPVREAFRRADTLEPAPESARPASPTPSIQAAQRAHQSTGAVDRFERALAGLPGAVAATPAPSLMRTGPRRGPDDLKRIRRIDADLEAALHKLGIRSFAEIGAWKAADVARVSKALGFKGRIEQENWIEQAQILATGRETYYSSQIGLAEPAPRPAAIDARPIAPARGPSPPAPAGPAVPPANASSGPRGGVEGAAATAAAMAAAAAASRIPPDAVPSPAAPPAPPAKPAPAPTPAPAAASASPLPRPSDPRPVEPVRDDLRRIEGITSDIEKLLNLHGVTRFAQIARWQAADVARFGGLLGQPARIQRENWIAQAARLERTAGQPAVPEKVSPLPVARVPAPLQPVFAAPSPGAPAAKPSDPPLAGQPAAAKPAGPTPVPAGSTPSPTPPAQPASVSVPVTKPAPPPSPPAQPATPGATEPQSPTAKPSDPPSAGQPAAAKPAGPTIVPAGSTPSPTPPAQPASVSAPMTKLAPPPSPPAQPAAAGATEPRSPNAKPADPPSAGPPATAKSAGPALVPVAAAPSAPASTAQPSSTSVPVTKPAPESPSATAVPTVVSSASVAGAAVASLAAAGAAMTVPRTPGPAAPDHPAPSTPQPLPAAESAASPVAPPPHGGPTRDAPGSAPASGPSHSELGHLRSIHSDGRMDDLKRIRGIGVLIEKKLNSMGVSRYEQIAKWTSTDIDRVSHVLDFKGRIERENWVEQARILASGGHTEFSRRADRGEFGGGA